MTVPIGWYAHHHGCGHLVRATQVASHLAAPVHLLTSAPVGVHDWTGPVVRLAPDVADGADTASGGPRLPRSPVLHWAPGDLPSLRTRTHQLTGFLDAVAPALVVVDVSVEVAMQARLSGVPVAWVRQHGTRDDPAHLAAYASASLVMAPWPAWLDDGDPVAADVPRQVHVGGFSRFQHRRLDPPQARRMLGWDPAERHVVVLLGGGGHDLSPDAVRAAARATPGWHWTVLGDTAPIGGGMATPGWVADPFPHLVAADVVVAATGHNAVMDVAAAGTVLVTVPQPRPFGEQAHKATLLDRHRIAHVWWSWPPSHQVAHRLAIALDDPRRPTALLEPDGAARAAATIDDLAFTLTAHRRREARNTPASRSDGLDPTGGVHLVGGREPDQVQ